MVIATTMANNRIRFGDIRSMFPSSRHGAVSELYKSSRWRRARSRLFYQQCGGTYRVLHGLNVSGVMGQRYSVCEEDQNEHPLTVWSLKTSMWDENDTLILNGIKSYKKNIKMSDSYQRP